MRMSTGLYLILIYGALSSGCFHYVDTLWLTVNELHDTRQPAQFIENAAVRIVRDSSMTVETWSFNGGRTAGTLAGVSLALLLVYAAIGSSVPGY